MSAERSAHVAGLGSVLFQPGNLSGLIDVRWDFQRGIADTHQPPIPRFARDAMPLEFERRRQRIDPLLEQLHHFALAAIDPNSARPLAAVLLAVHAHAECADPKTAHVSKAFVHTFQQAWPIIIPLIMIIVGYKTARGCPIFVPNRMKQVFRVTFNLPLRLPKPEKKQPDANHGGNTAIKSSTQ
jgi:hypothetical protein